MSTGVGKLSKVPPEILMEVLQKVVNIAHVSVVCDLVIFEVCIISDNGHKEI